MAIYSTFRGLQANPKVQTDVLDELLYADDMNKNAKNLKVIPKTESRLTQLIMMGKSIRQIWVKKM